MQKYQAVKLSKSGREIGMAVQVLAENHDEAIAKIETKLSANGLTAELARWTKDGRYMIARNVPAVW